MGGKITFSQLLPKSETPLLKNFNHQIFAFENEWVFEKLDSNHLRIFIISFYFQW
jgi:hypothetical protein